MPHTLSMALAQPRRNDEFRHILSKRVLFFTSKHLLRGLVPVDDLTLLVYRNNGIQRRMEYRCFSRLTLAQRGFRALAINKLPYLAAERRDCAHEFVVGSLHAVADKVDNAYELTTMDWKCQSPA